MARSVDHVVCARLSTEQRATFEALGVAIGDSSPSAVIRHLLAMPEVKELAYTASAIILAEARDPDSPAPPAG